MNNAYEFIIKYYDELKKNSSENEKLREKEFDREKIFKEAHKGIPKDREYVKKHIRKVLVDKEFREVLKENEFIISEENILEYVSYENIQDKFFKVLNFFKKKFDENALIEIIKKYSLSQTITSKDILKIYEKEKIKVNFEDNLEILVQKIYENYRGIPIIDELIYQNIEDIQVGVSGSSKKYNSVWVVILGKIYHLEFLNLKSSENTEIIVRKIISDKKIDNKNPSAFSYGFDGSRRVGYQGGFSDTWAGIIRKFTSVNKLSNKEIVNLSGARETEKLILAEKLLMKGCISSVIIGDQGSGKTVKTTRLIEYIYDDLAIRTINNNFETFLKEVYPLRNIIEFRETDDVTEQEAYEASLKSSGKITIFTEIRENHMIEHFLNSGRRGSKMALTSMHHNSADRVVYELAKGLMKERLHQKISDAIEDVLEVLKIVIEVQVSQKGNRYYNIYELKNNTYMFDENIYEDIDKTDSMGVQKIIAKALVNLAQPVNFITVPIVVYDYKTNSYIKENDFSSEIKVQMMKNFKKEDFHLIDEFHNVEKGRNI